jgi:hypothetical protein
MEIEILPGAIPDDMLQDELDEILADLKKMIEDGTLEENSIKLTEEEYNELVLEEEIVRH